MVDGELPVVELPMRGNQFGAIPSMHNVLALGCHFLTKVALASHWSLEAWGTFSMAAVVRCAP